MRLKCSILRKSCSFSGCPNTTRATLCFPEMCEGLPLSDLKEQRKTGCRIWRQEESMFCNALKTRSFAHSSQLCCEIPGPKSHSNAPDCICCLHPTARYWQLLVLETASPLRLSPPRWKSVHRQNIMQCKTSCIGLWTYKVFIGSRPVMFLEPCDFVVGAQRNHRCSHLV